jgi:glycosyltransferase involved in cell wall biosynthesis/2-polyprenyl-3-methyl-5-hydroxy-6-metoxy-1,4-benzoquinol methylase
LRVDHRPLLLVVGPTPPPFHGVTLMTDALLRLPRGNEFGLEHFDTSDHRDTRNIGTIDTRNALLALLHIASFARSLLAHRPSLVYLPLSQSRAAFVRDGALMVMARSLRVPVVIHAHGAHYREFYRRAGRLTQWFMRHVVTGLVRAIVLTSSQRTQFEGWIPSTTPVSVVPNGVADEWPDGPPVRPVGGRPLVLFLGNLLPEKGFLDALAAVPRVIEREPDVEFVFAGEQPWSADTGGLVDGIVNRLRPGVVNFVGRVDATQRHELLEAASVAVFTPRWDEGQGLVALEAMSASLPVVFTPSGGLKDSVRDGVDGIMVPKQNPEAISHAVLRLLEDSALRQLMGESARTHYEQEFTLSHWNERMKEVLLTTLADAEGSQRDSLPGSSSQSAVDWFSAGAAEFDGQYRSSALFSERVALWTRLIRGVCTPGCRVLDAGCGSGVFTVVAAEQAGEVVAVDASAEMLGICAERCDSLGITNCTRIQRRIEELGSAGLGQFDVVLSSSVLEYVENLPECLAALSLLLRPSGTLIASLPNSASVLRSMERTSFRMFRRPKYYGLVRNVLSVDDAQSALGVEGFTLLDTYYYGVPGALRRISTRPLVRRRVATMVAYVARRL